MENRIIAIDTLYRAYGMPDVILDRSANGLTPIQNSTAGPAPSYDDSSWSWTPACAANSVARPSLCCWA